ncbi:MAG: SRPBCC domain-containing protein [Acidobacteriota bacterium]
MISKEIRHSFFINAPVDTIADALMEERHIQNWWTKEALIKDGKGTLGWSGYGWEVELQMTRGDVLSPVVWKCLRSNMQNTNAWEGTTITFALVPQGTGTQIDFSQAGYRESPCYEVCNQGWAFFVGISLKQYIEMGKGIPYPEMQDTSKA